MLVRARALPRGRVVADCEHLMARAGFLSQKSFAPESGVKPTFSARLRNVANSQMQTSVSFVKPGLSV